MSESNAVEVLEPQCSITVAINKDDLLAVAVYEHERKLEEAKRTLSAEVVLLQKERDAVVDELNKSVQAVAHGAFDADLQKAIDAIKAFGFQDLTGELEAGIVEKGDNRGINVTLQLCMNAKTAYRRETITTHKILPIVPAVQALIAKRDKCIGDIDDRQSKIIELRRAMDNMSRNERAAKAQLAKMNLEQTDTGRKALAQLQDSTNMPGFRLLEGVNNA